MKAAIYSRKSKFTGKGESIQNQIEICKEYGDKHFHIDEFIIYEDEGFSGGNIDRPEYQRMLDDAEKKRFDILICYRLDRISRNISNFSEIIETLQNKGIAFVSVKEQFDTSTPMGRAMMYIASVFAQLERETIAERIRDNMLQLAKTGRWLGGTTPTGFVSKPVTNIIEGKNMSYYKLSPVEDELKIVKLIYDKFLQLKSLTKVETYCIQNNIKSKNGVDYSRFSLKLILSNPVYAIADKKLYDYLISNDYPVYASKRDFNGINGIMAYNKTLQKKNKSNKLKDVSEWIIAIGDHKGVISSEKWIAVQNLLKLNSSKTFRKVKNTNCLLAGLLRCSNCGSFMRPKYGRLKKNGEKAFYYICELKEKSRRQKCNVKNVNGNKLDKLLIEEIKKISTSSLNLFNKINDTKMNIQPTQSNIDYEIEILESSIKNNRKAINNLVNSLSQGKDKAASKYIIKEIDNLDKQASIFEERLKTLTEKTDNLCKESIDDIKNMLKAFPRVVDEISPNQKRNYIKNLIDEVTWDGEYLNVVVFGANPIDMQ
ncbi:recombinase family protein [Paramaledivibacter caminithermalis]|jgi:site-specific DNA recombinase|uniref:Site-specific DNA recombinase n=1 Tax=Paramaledivibacter caminithermalis (strain DSM 15212 / CIP 107654 / DViRD3) TaxID=1121301 RepID=A0A1M6JS56_PARC5|nr:recombinase family protein [Paramaledivibacter caminithermalis]SHJ49493.1 site-specific DNA recombinase [Paramaledivibacter caminithermalis DSM 15212]